jgi:hypothetical protein
MNQAASKRVSTGAKAPRKPAVKPPATSPLTPPSAAPEVDLAPQATLRTPTLPPLAPQPSRPDLDPRKNIPDEKRLSMMRQYDKGMADYRRMLTRVLPDRLVALSHTTLAGDGQVHVVERAMRYLLNMQKGQGVDIADVALCISELYPDFKPLVLQAQRYAVAMDSGGPSRTCPFCMLTVNDTDANRDRSGPKDLFLKGDIYAQPTGPRWHLDHKNRVLDRLRQLLPVHFKIDLTQQPGDVNPHAVIALNTRGRTETQAKAT